MWTTLMSIITKQKKNKKNENEADRNLSNELEHAYNLSL